MITDDSVLSRIVNVWQGSMFDSRWANLVGTWCIDFFRKYGKAPKQSIETVFDRWAEKNSDEATQKLVSKFLADLSGEYEQETEAADYVVDLAGNYFNRVKLLELADSIRGDVDNGDYKGAHSKVDSFSGVEIGVGAAIDVLSDEQAILAAFAEQEKDLVRYPGDLGKYFRRVFTRDAFVVFLAPEKKGKSFWLLDLAWRAMLQRNRVAFFEVGDMSQHQVMQRFMTRAARRPLHSESIQYPTNIYKDDEGKVTVESEERSWNTPLTGQDALRACQKVIKQTKSNQELLRLSVHPNSSINVFGIKSILQKWERAGWVPDVIVIDYVDILSPPSGVLDIREQINTTWKQLRALSQELHCLVVTATQAKASAYKAIKLGQEHAAEDKRKNAHVTAMIGINRTPSDIKNGVYRINFVDLRNRENLGNWCYTAPCLGISNPAVKSSF